MEVAKIILQGDEFKGIFPKCSNKDCTSTHADKVIKNLLKLRNCELVIPEFLNRLSIYNVEDIDTTGVDMAGAVHNQKKFKEVCTKLEDAFFASITLQGGDMAGTEIGIMDMATYAKQMELNDFALAKRIQQKIKYRFMMDKDTADLTYVENEIGGDLKMSSFNAYRMTPYHILTGCPRSLSQVGEWLNFLILQDIHISVSSMQENEKNCYGNFWRSEMLYEAPLRYKWYVESVTHKVSDYDKNVSETIIHLQQTNDVSYVKSSYAIHHYHYGNWKDAKEVPNQDSLSQLLSHIEDKHGHQSKIQMNCKHGRGRSGTMLLCHYLRQMVREKITAAAAATAVVWDDIKIDIPKLVCEFRKKRLDYLTRPQQLTNVYSMTGAFVKQLYDTKQFLEKEMEFSEQIGATIIAYL